MGANGTVTLGHEMVTILEEAAVDLTYDENYLYAACQDHRIRVWVKNDWQLIAELGDDWMV